LVYTLVKFSYGNSTYKIQQGREQQLRSSLRALLEGRRTKEIYQRALDALVLSDDIERLIAKRVIHSCTSIPGSGADIHIQETDNEIKAISGQALQNRGTPFTVASFVDVMERE